MKKFKEKLKTLDSYRQKDDTGPLSNTIYKTEIKMNEDLNVRTKPQES